MKIQKKLIIISIFAILMSIGFISAVVVDTVTINKLFPGQTSQLTISVKNTLKDDVEDVSFVLKLDDTSFTTLGGSEDSEDEIREGRKETFSFVLKASSSIKPGDYNIPYEITYTDADDEKIRKTGSIGVTVTAETELSYSIESDNNVVNEKGKISVKVINSGLGDIGFVSVRIVSASGFEVLSADEEYIGTVGSDDFELATFDILFKRTNANLGVEITYKDFNNNEETKIVSLPVKVYSREKALELGLIKKNNTLIYTGSVLGIIIIWYIYRRIKKNRRKSVGG